MHRLIVRCIRFRDKRFYLRRAFHSAPPLSSPHVCVVGAGPAGFYTAQAILKTHPSARVDILERLPVPFGLVRFGVAPDHPEVKNVISTFTQTAQNARCAFWGNVEVGKDISVAELRSLYDAIVFSYGAAADRDLGVPGEELKGVIPARRFVGWYNGVPEDTDLGPDLGSSENAVIVGQGNVALDIARVLLSPVKSLRETDITRHALEAIEKNSNIRNVYVVGRRGPRQVAFTIKEFREMVNLPDCCTSLDDPGKEQLALIEGKLDQIPRPKKRLTELLLKVAKDKTKEAKNSARFLFLSSPTEILGDDQGRVRAIRFGRNKLVGPPSEDQRAEPDDAGEVLEIPCGLVVKSIGYKSVLIDKDIPFDPKRGVIPNVGGRIDGATGLYCSGWVRRGPTGVIATTMNDAVETGKNVAEDLAKIEASTLLGAEGLRKLTNERKVDVIGFTDWETINEFEMAEGAKVGKPREKVTEVKEMLRLTRKSREAGGGGGDARDGGDRMTFSSPAEPNV